MPIRLRLALLFALGTAALIAMAGYLFADQLGDGLLSTLDAGLRPRAELTGRTLAAAAVNRGPDGSPASIAGSFTQVYDPTGVLVGASMDAGHQEILTPADIRAARGGPISATRRISDTGEGAVAGEVVRVRAIPVNRPDGTWLVAVGTPVETVDDAVARVRHAVEFGGPPVVILAGLAAWLVAGSALRPVERMRREVAEISEHGADEAIVVPRTHDEIAKLAATMNDVLGQLKRALDRERRFVIDAGHELRTPLTVLQGELELAGRHGRTRAELAEAVDAASIEVRRLTALAEDLLAIGRDGAVSPRVEPVNIAAVARESVAAYAARADSRGVRIRSALDESAVINGDPLQLRRAIDNLMDNALRFAPPDSEITVSALRTGAGATIEVSDRGPGFPPNFLPNAFERFRRADDARSRQHGGTGLGLALVRQVATAHGGDAVATNLEAGGASVRIELPSRPDRP